MQDAPKKKRPKFGIPSDQEDNENESVNQVISLINFQLFFVDG